MDMGYFTDPRDNALCGLTPTLMAPLFGQLDPPTLGLHRYIIAANGLFLQAHSPALEVCIKVADTPSLPYGKVQEYVRMACGLIPAAMYERMRDMAVAACPREWAGIVLFDPAAGAYRLHEPDVESASPGHITYQTSGYEDEYRVLDIHSHGVGKAYFSSMDDRSDSNGVYLACVLGECQTTQHVNSVTRIVVNGQFFPVAWSPWGA